MGVPFSSQAYHQLPLLGVVPLQLSAWVGATPSLVALGVWLTLDQQCLCVCI